MITKLKTNLYALLAAPFRHGNILLDAIEQDDYLLLEELLNHLYYSPNPQNICEALNKAILTCKRVAVTKLLERINGNALKFATHHNNPQLVYTLLHNSLLRFTGQERAEAFELSAASADQRVLGVFLNELGSTLPMTVKKRALVNAAKANQPIAFVEILNHIDFNTLSPVLREKLFAWAVHFGHRSIIHQILEVTSLLVDENAYQEWISHVLATISQRTEIAEYFIIILNNRGFTFNTELLTFAKEHLSIDAKNGILQLLSFNNFEPWLATMGASITIETRMYALSKVENIPAIVRHTVDIGGMLFLAVSNQFNEAVAEILRHPDRLSEDNVLEAIIEADLNDNTQALILIERVLQHMPGHIRGNILLYAIENNRPAIIQHVITPCAAIPANYIRLARVLAANQDEPMIAALGEVPRFLDDLYDVTDTQIEEARTCFQSNSMLMQYCGLNESSSESDYSDDMDEDTDTEHRSKRRVISK